MLAVVALMRDALVALFKATPYQALLGRQLAILGHGKVAT